MYDRCRERPPFPRINRRHHFASGLMFGNFGGGASTKKYVDSSLYGNHGTLTNMEPATDWFWWAELNRFAMNTGGTDECVLGTIPTIWAQFTYHMWVRDLGSEFHAPAQPFSAFDGTTRPALEFALAATPDYTYVIATQTNYARWDDNHAVSTTVAYGATWDGTTAALFKNGVNQGAAAATGDPSNSDATGYAIGCRRLVASDRFFTGYVTDVLLWSRVLSPSEIQQLADPSNVMLSGLILPPRRRLWAVSGGAPAVTRRNIIIGGGVA